MTAIVKHKQAHASPYARAGLILPGLGHLIPYVGTLVLSMRLWQLRNRKQWTGDMRLNEEIFAAEDRYDDWMRVHGSHGDAPIGFTLLCTIAMLIWSAVVGLPRLPDMLFTDPSNLTVHPLTLTYWVLVAVGYAVIGYLQFFSKILVEDVVYFVSAVALSIGAVLGWWYLLPSLFDLSVFSVTWRIAVHPLAALDYWVIAAAGCWFVAYRRAYPRELTEEQFNSAWQVFLRNFLKNRTGMIGVFGVLVMIGLTLLTPMVAPYDPNIPFIGDANKPPGWHLPKEAAESVFCLLGTDSIGRDVFSRILYGSRISLAIGFMAVGIAGTLGTSVGAVAGYFGSWADRVLMWLVDFLLSLPRLILLLAILGIFSSDALNAGAAKIFLIVGVLSLTGWMGVARIVRSSVLSLKQQDFIQAAQALGMSPLRIVYRHLIPNALAPVIVYASLAIGSTILTEAALSFLGIGVSEPTPTWGTLVNDGRKSFLGSPWQSTFPGLCIVWAVMAFNLLGDGMRDALDPKLRGKG